MHEAEERQGSEPDPEAAPPEDRPGEPGAEGGSESARRSKLPFLPEKSDDSPLGDTDQHSTG